MLMRNFKSRRQVGLMTGMYRPGSYRQFKNALSTGWWYCQVHRFFWYDHILMKHCPALGDLLTVMTRFPRLLLFGAAFAAITGQSFGQLGEPGGPVHQQAPKEPVWQVRMSDFDKSNYDRAVEALISSYENSSGHKLAPRAKKRVGLKVYTDSGPGLATPIALVQAVIDALKRRGYENRNIFLVGLNSMRLRMTGYLPSLVTGKTPFVGNPVYVLESKRYYDPVWFYPSPLPDRFDPIVAQQQTSGYSNSSTVDEDRKSYLATPLFLDADFWINLPVYTDHAALGVNGALVNATLWNASNTASRRRDERDPRIEGDVDFHDREPGGLPVYRRPVLQFAVHGVRAVRLAERRPGDDGRAYARQDESLAAQGRIRGDLRRHPHPGVRRDLGCRIRADPERKADHCAGLTGPSAG
jgi:hypothetical protein